MGDRGERSPAPQPSGVNDLPQRATGDILWSSLEPGCDSLMLFPFEFSYHPNSGFNFAWKGHPLTTIGSILLTGGVGAITAPWWYPLLAIALGKTGVTMEPAANWLIGAVLILLGLSCFGWKHLRVDRPAKRMAADKALVQRRPPRPQIIRNYFDGLTTNDDYRSSADSAFQAEYTLYASTENRLTDERAIAAFDAFRAAAQRLHRFAQENFEWWPENQVGWEDHRYCLAPHLNIDRGNLGDRNSMLEYDELQKQLDDYVAAVRETYEAFLDRLRKNGAI